ncbi:unnamed protein product [Nippostrongylus brasiliensis]|uniref:Uncharacterized protein n=1 Tax=Nippostrongylus brasiliensis TaxID=27835 RepID=A0A0N4XHW3_NIPBR|nr:unnamed protein product [Nippostrongylus brasiliensis]
MSDEVISCEEYCCSSASITRERLSENDSKITYGPFPTFLFTFAQLFGATRPFFGHRTPKTDNLGDPTGSIATGSDVFLYTSATRRCRLLRLEISLNSQLIAA